MSRLRSALPFVLLAACFLAAAATLFSFLDSDEPAAPGASQTLRAAAHLHDRTVAFGDRVLAELELVVPSGATEEEVRFTSDFSPYRASKETSRREYLGAGLDRITVSYELSCLRRACIPGAQGVALTQFAPSRVSIPGSSMTVAWPPMTVTSRLLTGQEVTAEQATLSPTLSPELQGRTSATEALLVLLLGAALLGAWPLSRMLRREDEIIEERVSPAPDALLEALAAAETEIVEERLVRQRHAFERLSVELRAAGLKTLGDEAEQIAWAPENFSSDSMRALLGKAKRQRRRQA